MLDDDPAPRSPTFPTVRAGNRIVRGVVVGACALALVGVVRVARAAAPEAAPVGSIDLGGVVTTICSNQGSNGRDGGRATCGGQPNVGGVWQSDDGWVTNRRWQCVEFAQRVYEHMGWWTGPFPVAYAFEIFDRAAGMGMVATRNGKIDTIVPGDMIITDTGVSTTIYGGHVLVVERVDGATVVAKQQNTAPAEVTYTLAAGQLVDGPFVGHIRGIVHSPLNTAWTAGDVGEPEVVEAPPVDATSLPAAGAASSPGAATSPVVLRAH